MKTQEWTTLPNKAEWGHGEWVGEPDKVQWQDEDTGLPCLAVRNQHSGNWCGYVGVAEGHPKHGEGYNAVDVDVHGGLTFANACIDHSLSAWEAFRERSLKRRASAAVEAVKYPIGDAAHWLADKEAQASVDSHEAFVAYTLSHSICHTPEPGEPDMMWWFGFDCAHSGDVSPAREARCGGMAGGYESYRTLRYVQNQCAKLAQQLKGMQ